MSDNLVKNIHQILFPPLEKEYIKEYDTTLIIDRSVDSNLEGLLSDIMDNKVSSTDKISLDTLNDVIRRLTKVKTLIEMEYPRETLMIDDTKKHLVMVGLSQELS